MTLHTYTPQPKSLSSMNFLHLTVSEIQPGQTISRRPPAHLYTKTKRPYSLKVSYKISVLNKPFSVGPGRWWFQRAGTRVSAPMGDNS